jgi:serine/threonine protein kinase
MASSSSAAADPEEIDLNEIGINMKIPRTINFDTITTSEIYNALTIIVDNSKCIIEQPIIDSVIYIPYKAPNNSFISINGKDYIILSNLGHGTYGTVYKLFNKDDRKMYALKVQMDINRMYFIEAINHFILKKYSSVSNNIPEIYTIGKAIHDHTINRHVYIYTLMEYLTGNTLNNIISGHTNISKPDKTKEYLCKIPSILQSLQTEFNFTHGDFKSDNIFITTTGDIKIIDYGFSRIDYKSIKIEASRDFNTSFKPGRDFTVLMTFIYYFNLGSADKSFLLNFLNMEPAPPLNSSHPNVTCDLSKFTKRSDFIICNGRKIHNKELLGSLYHYFNYNDNTKTHPHKIMDWCKPPPLFNASLFSANVNNGTPPVLPPLPLSPSGFSGSSAPSAPLVSSILTGLPPRPPRSAAKKPAGFYAKMGGKTKRKSSRGGRELVKPMQLNLRNIRNTRNKLNKSYKNLLEKAKSFETIMKDLRDGAIKPYFKKIQTSKISDELRKHLENYCDIILETYLDEKDPELYSQLLMTLIFFTEYEVGAFQEFINFYTSSPKDVRKVLVNKIHWNAENLVV